MIKRYQGKTKFMWLPWTTGQTVTKGGLVCWATGKLIPAVAGYAGDRIVGVSPIAITSASDVYTTQGNVAVEVPVEKNVIWECDVDTTEALVSTDMGDYMDLSSESGYTNGHVDSGESTEDIFYCVGFISATKGLFILNIGPGCNTGTDV